MRVIAVVMFLVLPIVVAARGRLSGIGDKTSRPPNQTQRGTAPQHLVKLSELPPENDQISSVAISPDEELVAYSVDRRKVSRAKRLFVFSIDKLFAASTTVKIWNRRTNSIQATIHTDTVGGCYMRFTSNSRSLITHSGYSAGVVQIWDAQTGRLIAKF